MDDNIKKKGLSMEGLEMFATKVKTYVQSQIATLKKLIVNTTETHTETQPDIDLSDYDGLTYIECTNPITSLSIVNEESYDYEIVIHFTVDSTTWNGLTIGYDYKIIDDPAYFEVEAGGEYELSIRNNIFVLAEINTQSATTSTSE